MSTKIFQILNKYLDQEFSDDHWYDSAFEEAATLISQLTPRDWDTLKSSIQNKPRQWQIRCIEVLGWGDINQAVSVFLERLKASDKEIALAAVDCLVDLDLTKFQLDISEDTLCCLKEAAKGSKVNEMSVNYLLEQLKSE
jgi:hypothetical protein